MPQVRELQPGEEHLAASALLELRPQFGDAETIAREVAEQRADGYRLLASFSDGDDEAAAVAGFREVRMLAWGRAIYVDDLVTRPEHRGAGHATALLQALDEEARRLGCGELHLDSGVIPERQAAHRRYFGHGMRVASFHFSKVTSKSD